MKYLLLLSIFLVSLCSLCIQLPDLTIPGLESSGIVTTDMGSPDIFLNVETSSSQINSGRGVQVFVELRNKQAYDLNNVHFEVYDNACFPENLNSGLFVKDDCGDEGTLKGNRSCVWSWRWTSDPSEIDRQCSIKFLTSYEAKNSVFQDIAVLSLNEYQQREMEGTLQSIPISSSYAKGPLNVYLSFPESQPFIAGLSEYAMDINYNNNGNGFLEDVKIYLIYPNNIMDLSCDGYISSGSTLSLIDELKFIKGRAVPTRCSFKTASTSTIDIKSIDVAVIYEYKIYDSIPITVKAK
ncbi:MAG: hypothetical protein ABIE55_00145 [Candidatus Aenigmatarchaeota archaeon]